MNKVVLIGRLIGDPELSHTPENEIAVVRFTLEVERSYLNKGTGKRDVDYIDIIVWRKQAEICSNHLKKGSLVAVVGRLQIRAFIDGQGIRRKSTEIVADDVSFLLKSSIAIEGNKPMVEPVVDSRINDPIIPF